MERIETLSVSNFKGALTKDLLGDINSGLCPISLPNYGTDPFWDKFTGSLSFLPDVVSKGSTDIKNPLLNMVSTASPVSANAQPMAFMVDMSGTVYAYTAALPNVPTPDDDTISIFVNTPTAITLNYGGGILISSVDGTRRLYVGSDDTPKAIYYSSSMNYATATWATIITAQANVPRPMVEFLGKIYVADGKNLAETNVSTTTLNKLSPSLPADYVIRDLAVSSDGRYLMGIATQIQIENVLDTSAGNQKIYNLPNSVIFYWNGSDTGYSFLKFMKGINLSSLVVTNTYTAIFGKDDEGLSLYDLDGNRMAQIFDGGLTETVYPPIGGQSFPVGKKIFFLAQRGSVVGLYCFDQKDNSIYCLYQQTLTAETIRGAVCFASGHTGTYAGADTSRPRIVFAFSKLPVATQANNLLYRMHTQNASESVQQGCYSTQVQKFAKKIKIGEVRFFCEPTQVSNSFTAYLLNSSGTAITGSTMTYAYAAGTDETKLQGALDVIRFTPQMNTTQSLGLQFNNTGTASITIHKVEIGYVYVSRTGSYQ